MRAVSLSFCVIALVVCAWFGLGARQAIDTQRATAIVSQGATASAAQEREVSSLVRAARVLNPDQQPNVLLGRVEIERGQVARGRKVLEAVTRREPQNLGAWVQLATSSGNDRPLLRRAARRVVELEPRIP